MNVTPVNQGTPIRCTLLFMKLTVPLRLSDGRAKKPAIKKQNGHHEYIGNIDNISIHRIIEDLFNSEDMAPTMFDDL